ncbi:NAD(P)-dependent oxidoreductase [Murdochiella vaginalis]|uniref:NAD(P)-dependent oxidoreductase n=1 Tax=Murdochiella vaginalis TaxID=1852373 RepID=UPI0008FE00C1|nr:NAD(P)-dependent oxidoreductase [Murdochiella vaginalis]
MKYDIMHFEALGEEAEHLQEETDRLVAEGKLKKDFSSVITPLTLQEYLKQENLSGKDLPNIVTTKTHSVLPEEWVNSEPKKSVITRSAGYDHFEHLQNKLNIASLRVYCVKAVAQTAIKFLYAAAGYLNEYSKNTLLFERNKTHSFHELGPDMVATVFGVGNIGAETYRMLVQNGLTVQAVDVRAEELKGLDAYKDFHFVDKETAIKNSDVILNVMNLTKSKESRFYNVNYFDQETLSKAKKGIILINVTRGEIMPEHVVLEGMEKGQIIGFGTDVFSYEERITQALRNGETKSDDPDIDAALTLIHRALNREANVYVQPHQGFNSDVAAVDKAKEAMAHVAFFFNEGKGTFREQLPYYES